jgi:hypothetical protein
LAINSLHEMEYVHRYYMMADKTLYNNWQSWV